MKKLAIVIPHYNGEDILQACVNSLYGSRFTDFQIYVVDNGSSDDSVALVKREFPEVTLLLSKTNLGYAGGCNYGYSKTNEPFVLFYNNDTEIEPNGLSELLKKMEQSDTIGAVQPKLLSFQNKEKFDYSGACGGEMDYLGYPFARGRIFETIEADTYQYDTLDTNVFWASGTAMLVRRKAIEQVGCFDEDFFAHMEEIDLSWRLHLFGWEVHVAPKSIVYHYSGYTLGAMNPKKMYLNHRNNLLMMYKNLSKDVRSKILWKRYFLELITVIAAFLTFDFTRLKAVVTAFKDYLQMRSAFYQKQKFIEENKLTEIIGVYPRSIVATYFVKKLRKYSEILDRASSLK